MKFDVDDMDEFALKPGEVKAAGYYFGLNYLHQLGWEPCEVVDTADKNRVVRLGEQSPLPINTFTRYLGPIRVHSFAKIRQQLDEIERRNKLYFLAGAIVTAAVATLIIVVGRL